jgi:tRNA threonylcarbamoyladenosine biosynthesis protein TsaE
VSDADTQALGARIGRALKPGTVIALFGGLAAGKTTLAKGIARGLEVAEDVTSPTYTIISEYSGRLRLFHMDAYRLENEDDFRSLGADEYLYGDGICVIEWSERIEGALPKEAARIVLEALPDGSRRILVTDPYLEGMLS